MHKHFLILCLAALLGACGGGGKGDDNPRVPVTDTPSHSTTPPAAAASGSS